MIKNMIKIFFKKCWNQHFFKFNSIFPIDLIIKEKNNNKFFNQEKKLHLRSLFQELS